METRKHYRAEIQLKAVFQIDSNDKQKFSILQDNALEAKVVDISISGIGIVVKYFLPKGLIIDLEIDGEYFGLEHPMKVKGEIRYCNYIKNKGYRCGVKFIDITKEYSSRISDFIAKHEQREVPRFKLSD